MYLLDEKSDLILTVPWNFLVFNIKVEGHIFEDLETNCDFAQGFRVQRLMKFGRLIPSLSGGSRDLLLGVVFDQILGP